MEKLTRQAIADLVSQHKGPLVTMYVPTIKSASPPHMSENQLRLKNTFTKAMQLLKKKKDSEKLITALKEKLDKALNDYRFWEEQGEGLLVCASSSGIHVFCLPMDTEEYVAVDDIYHLAPVLAFLHDAISFYVLAASQHKPTLFRGDMYGLSEVKTDLPYDLKHGLHLDEANPRGEQSHSASGSQTNTAGYNGRGGGHDPRDDMRQQFFRLVDQIVCNTTDRTLPLILAGTDTETAEYRNLSKYPYILTHTISGSFGGAKAHDLCDKALRIIHQELVDARHNAAIQSFKQLQGTNPERTATDKITISAATERGQIGTLFVSLNRTTADTVQEDTRPVNQLTFPARNISKLINKIAVMVEKERGKIINIEAEALPSKPAMAAILRY
jgi:hypothetical protein